MTGERAYWWAWSQMEGVGPVTIKRLHQHFSSLALAWEADPGAWQQVEGIGPKLALAIAAQRSSQPPVAPPGDYLTPADTAYPKVLFEISDPPPVLYYRGDVAALQRCQTQPAVAIVGTRSPSDYGRRWTRRLSAALGQAGVVVVSGLAEGIDREAHQSCLDQQGMTIAVLGTGVDGVYPPSNRALQGAIAERGLLVSEYPLGTGPDRTHFPRRNRIIAGLSRVVLVTEAPSRSGALITARLANDYGREVYVVPGSLDNDRCRGCLELINQGAQLVLGPETLVQALGALPMEANAAGPSAIAPTEMTQGRLPLATPEPPPELDPILRQVWQGLKLEPMTLDMIVAQVPQLSTGEVLSALTQLELMGLVGQLPGNRYQRSA